MEHIITEFMDRFGYLGIFLLIALENIFPPIPSEIILTFGGFMTTTSDLTKTGVVIASTLGSTGGAAVLYGIGRKLGLDGIKRLIKKKGHYLRLKGADIEKADDLFNKYGGWTVFFGRLIPLIRSLISIPAGMTKMNITFFFILTAGGTLIWNTVLVNLGAAFGSSWRDIAGYFDVFANFIYLILAALFILVILILIKKKGKG
ncbi:DedA family protein [Peribacillus sp. SCS-37]|uniref:DedA family protein n=1 Tax=Paraperibacillus esterisolvens TaxID=3115296 RepID=UPI003906367E